MSIKCAHAESEEIASDLQSLGWNKIHETKKTVWFENSGFQINFNGENYSSIDLVFDPTLAGANIEILIKSGAIIHERFSSNFGNLPKKLSKDGKLQNFGVGIKFVDRLAANNLLAKLQIPEVSK